MSEFSNYKMPFHPKSLMESGGEMATCSVPESIAQNIMLLIVTRKGENRFDPDYGNEVWDLEFDTGISESRWETILTQSLRQQILEYEQRLSHPKVSAKLTYVEQTYEMRKFTEIKRKVNIVVSAIILESGERFNFQTELFLSPLSVE